jgi:hypothetical protein
MVPQGIATSIEMNVIRAVPVKRGIAPKPTVSPVGRIRGAHVKPKRKSNTETRAKNRKASPTKETTIPIVTTTAPKAQRKKK